ncbi:enoyl-CoA hydratase-related protein, partial [Streptomyces sparsus]
MTDPTPDTPGELVHRSDDRGIAVLTLDSPHNRNALSVRLVSELRTHLTAAGNDDSVRAVLLTHTGGTFCAGADLRDGSGSPADVVELLRAVVELPRPVLAAVDG